MGEDEVLAARLAHQPWIAAVLVESIGDALPELMEDRRRPGKMDAGETRIGDQHIAYGSGLARDELDHARGQAGLLENLIEEPIRQHRRGRRLPECHVAEYGRCGGEVATDRGEVERRDRVDKSFERPIVEPVPHARHRDRLFVQQPFGIVHIEAEEVGEFARGIDLRLVRRLPLAQQRGGVHPRAPRAAQQVGGLHEYGSAIGECPVLPILLCLGGAVDGVLQQRCRRLMHRGELVPVPLRRGDVDGLAGAMFEAVDDDGDVGDSAAEFLDRGLKCRALRGARGVTENRFVDGNGDVADGAHLGLL